MMNTDSIMLRSLTGREGWMRVFTYGLFIFSAVSIAGIELCVITLYALLLYHRLRTRITEPLPAWVYAPFLLLAAWAVLSALANPNPLSNLDKLRGQYRLFLPLVLVPALFTVDIRRLLKVYLVVAALVSLYAFFQYFWGGDLFRSGGSKYLVPGSDGIYRGYATGTYSMYLTFSGVMLMAVPVFASLFFSTAKPERWIWGAGAVLTCGAVIVSLGRAGWLGMAFGLLVLSLRLPRRWALPLLGSALVVVTVLASLFATDRLESVLGGPAGSPIINRFIRSSPVRDSQRFALWTAALRGIADKPLLGHGMNYQAYNRYRDELANERGLIEVIKPNIRPHNTYLRIGFSMGLIGLIMYLWIWGAVFTWNARWIKQATDTYPFERGLLWGITGALAGSMVNGLFGGHFFDAEVQAAMLMWMGLSLHTGILIRRADRSLDGHQQGRFFPFPVRP